tara:strand:- start:2017 stop:2301 length:285 start_codon:yes stop_codon:yes gene_type:complete
MAETKLYVGKGVEKFGGNLVEISVCLSDIPQEHRFEYKGKWYAKLKVSKMRQTDEYGKTHSVAINTYKPPVQEEGSQEAPVKVEKTEADPDLPF